jgi:hypothetical protein
VISKKTVRLEGPTPINQVKCVSCGNHKPPQFCYMGSVLGGECNASKTTEKGGDLICVMDTYEKSYTLRSETYSQVHRFKFHKRVRGYICSDCASDYRMVGNQPRIKTDSRVISTLAVPEIERRMDAVPVSKQSSPTVSKASSPSLNVDSNHWLSVGRKK